MRIRAAEKDEADLMAMLHARCFPPEQAWSEAQMQGSLDQPTSLCFFAIEEGEALAGMILIQKIMDEGEILTLCVDPHFRRQGIGQALMRQIMSFSDLKTIYLEVAGDNMAAQHLYEKMGFEVTGRRKGYYARPSGRVDAINYRYLV